MEVKKSGLLGKACKSLCFTFLIDLIGSFSPDHTCRYLQGTKIPQSKGCVFDLLSEFCPVTGHKPVLGQGCSFSLSLTAYLLLCGCSLPLWGKWFEMDLVNHPH